MNKPSSNKFSPTNTQLNSNTTIFDNRIKKRKQDENYSYLFTKKIWRVADVAVFLNVSKGHIYNLCYKRMIPKYKKGKCLYFLPQEILNWILNGELV